MVNLIADRSWLQRIYYLLEFLAAWEKRPAYLTLMAYEWCSAISNAAGRLGQREIPIVWPHLLWEGFYLGLRSSDYDSYLFHQHRLYSQLSQFKLGLGIGLRLRHRDLGLGVGSRSPALAVEREFSKIGFGCDLVRLEDASHQSRRAILEDLTPLNYAHLLSTTLEIGFRLAEPGRDQQAFRLNHTSHRDWVFETAFSSHDDEVIADAVCLWIADRGHRPRGSFMGYFAKRVERDTPFSPRLRRVSIRALEHIWDDELVESVSGTIHLLDHLDVDVDDMVEKDEWVRLLLEVICFLAEPESLSSHYWHLLDKLRLPIALKTGFRFGLYRVSVTSSLEEAEDWEKLETWMAIVWSSLLVSSGPAEEFEQVTLKLLSRRPSALPRFEGMCGGRVILLDVGDKLQRICDQVRTEQSPSESSPAYVPIRPPRAPIRSDTFFLLQSTDTHPTIRSPSFCRRRHLLKYFIVYAAG